MHNLTALDRTMSPMMVAEYSRLLVPESVMKKSLEEYCSFMKQDLANGADESMTKPMVRVEHGCVITTFRRPDWARTGMVVPDPEPSCQITGTTCQITGTTKLFGGTRWVVSGDDPFMLLPRMRKDARENAEMILHEIIADNNATMAQICARTGLALRTINNAIQALRSSGILVAKTEKSNEDRPQSWPQSWPQSMDNKILSLLFFGEKSRSEICAKVGVTPKTNSLRLSLARLMDDGLIAYTIPDTPKRMLQKYALTEQGRRFLLKVPCVNG